MRRRWRWRGRKEEDSKKRQRFWWTWCWFLKSKDAKEEEVEKTGGKGGGIGEGGGPEEGDAGFGGFRIGFEKLTRRRRKKRWRWRRTRRKGGGFGVGFEERRASPRRGKKVASKTGHRSRQRRCFCVTADQNTASNTPSVPTLSPPSPHQAQAPPPVASPGEENPMGGSTLGTLVAQHCVPASSQVL